MKTKIAVLIAIVAAAVVINGPEEMATVERCEGTVQQCQRL